MNSEPFEQKSPDIHSMQKYIVELTAFINQNNQKYTKNLQTLKNFYEKQIHQLDQTIFQNEQIILEQKNELLLIKDVLANKNIEIDELKQKVHELNIQFEGMKGKYQKQMQKNEITYKNIDQLRDNMNQKLNKQIVKTRKAEEESQSTLILLKQKESQVRQLKDSISILEKKLAERYTLPDQVQRLKVQFQKSKVKAQCFSKNLQKTQNQKNALTLQVEKIRKENEKLRIDNKKSKNDLKHEVQIIVRKQKQGLLAELNDQKLENEKKLIEIEDLKNRYNSKCKEINLIQKKLKAVIQQEEQNEAKIKELKVDKQLYLDQFRKLKTEYQEIIMKLEAQIPSYMQKNWKLARQNEQLNTQLNGLRDVLQELKLINNFEPLKQQSLKWTQFSLFDEKIKQQNAKKQFPEIKFEEKDELNHEWKQLMKDIEKIQA